MRTPTTRRWPMRSRRLKSCTTARRAGRPRTGSSTGANLRGFSRESFKHRGARVFGKGEEWMLPRLMAAMARGRVWLPAGGRVMQTFVAAEDVGRACLAAADRGRAGKIYLVGGFDATWRDLLESSARGAGVGADIVSLPYDFAYLRALMTEITAARGASVWPGVYA